MAKIPRLATKIKKPRMSQAMGSRSEMNDTKEEEKAPVKIWQRRSDRGARARDETKRIPADDSS